jgi:hypothetical protein
MKNSKSYQNYITNREEALKNKKAGDKAADTKPEIAEASTGKGKERAIESASSAGVVATEAGDDKKNIESSGTATKGREKPKEKEQTERPNLDGWNHIPKVVNTVSSVGADDGQPEKIKVLATAVSPAEWAREKALKEKKNEDEGVKKK